MSYCRNPYYIWSDGEHMHFDLTAVPDVEVNVLLYKLMLSCRRDELAERLRQGRAECQNQTSVVYFDENGNQLEPKDFSKMVTFNIVPMSHDNPEHIAYMEWMKSQEDDVLRKLMGEEHNANA